MEEGHIVDMILNDQLEANAEKLHGYLGVLLDHRRAITNHKIKPLITTMNRDAKMLKKLLAGTANGRIHGWGCQRSDFRRRGEDRRSDR